MIKMSQIAMMQQAQTERETSIDICRISRWGKVDNFWRPISALTELALLVPKLCASQTTRFQVKHSRGGLELQSNSLGNRLLGCLDASIWALRYSSGSVSFDPRVQLVLQALGARELHTIADLHRAIRIDPQWFADSLNQCINEVRRGYFSSQFRQTFNAYEARFLKRQSILWDYFKAIDKAHAHAGILRFEVGYLNEPFPLDTASVERRFDQVHIGLTDWIANLQRQLGEAFAGHAWAMDFAENGLYKAHVVIILAGVRQVELAQWVLVAMEEWGRITDSSPNAPTSYCADCNAPMHGFEFRGTNPLDIRYSTVAEQLRSCAFFMSRPHMTMGVSLPGKSQSFGIGKLPSTVASRGRKLHHAGGQEEGSRGAIMVSRAERRNGYSDSQVVVHQQNPINASEQSLGLGLPPPNASWPWCVDQKGPKVYTS